MKALFSNAAVAVHFANLMEYYPNSPATSFAERMGAKNGQINLAGMTPTDIRIECQRIRAAITQLPDIEQAALNARYRPNSNQRAFAIKTLCAYFGRLQSWESDAIEDLLCRHYTEEGDRFPWQSLRELGSKYGHGKDRMARIARDMAFELERLERSALAQLAPGLYAKEVIARETV